MKYDYHVEITDFSLSYSILQSGELTPPNPSDCWKAHNASLGGAPHVHLRQNARPVCADGRQAQVEIFGYSEKPEGS
jgi:hypothetical protein